MTWPRIRSKPIFVTTIFCLLLPRPVYAASLTGTVHNGTTNKPAVGDEVTLIKLAQGMEEAASTRTDAAGKFVLNIDDDGQPHLIRVTHQNVTYHQAAPPGISSLDINVYDVAAKVANVAAVADLMYLQAQRGQLGVSRIFALNNSSKPPRTQMNDHNFEFYLPDGAQIDTAQAQTAGGRWVDSSPIPQQEKGRYAFNFPLRPGQTEFQVSYHLPYTGKASIDPKLIYPLDHFVVIMPEAIQFAPARAGIYETKQPPSPPGAIAEVASKAAPGEPLSFEISGSGILQDDSSPDQTSSVQSTTPEPRPGGGLGPPIDAPDPLQKYRWPLIGSFAVLLAVGAIYISFRSRKIAAPNFASDVELADGNDKMQPAGRSALLLEALKEELFQLEVDRKQGRISEEEYEKAKSALDQTLERALKRSQA